MKKLIPVFIFIAASLYLSFKQPTQKQATNTQEEPREIIIKAISGLQYDSVRFKVKPGETVKITLINTDEMAHNLVITKPGERVSVVDMALKMGNEGQQKNFIPESDKILASIPILNPEEKYSITFTAPDKEGVYPYVCTYPGHGSVMYGAMYVTNNLLPTLANDTHIPEQRRAKGAEAEEASGHPYPRTFPMMYRTFLPDTGPASMAVGMLNNLSYCWDAGSCRFRYLWKGGFVDMQRNWGGKGKQRADIVGVVFYRESSEAPFRIGSKEHTPEPEFKGYSMQNRYPTFRYMLDDVEVTERITPTLEKPGMKRTLSFKDLQYPLWFVLEENDEVEIYVNKGKREGNFYKLTPEEAQDFTITVTEKSREI
ncbi:MAG: plastocyanin/azurin family copper-binding protein [Cyclobacteriaceae bacterium]